MKQVQTTAKLHQIWDQNVAILLCNWCARMVYRPSLPLLHPIYLRSKFCQMKKTNHYWITFRKNYDVSPKCKDIWATQFSWVEMFKSDFGDIDHVKCNLCSNMKGKEIILGPKSNTLEKHEGKTKAIWDMPLGKK